MSKKHSAVAVFLFLGITSLFVLYKMSHIPVLKDISVATGTMRFEVVTTQEAQEKGLSGKTAIPSNYGMLFVFKTPDRYGFWMKGMLTPIDIVWLTSDGTITLIDASVDPGTYPHAFYPPVPVSYVLETKAGFAAEKGWIVGSKIALPPPYGS